MTRYVALLRGINVGGKNLIKMAELKACFEAEGFGDVATYIQSGNVLFGAAGSLHQAAQLGWRSSATTSTSTPRASRSPAPVRRCRRCRRDASARDPRRYASFAVLTSGSR